MHIPLFPSEMYQRRWKQHCPMLPDHRNTLMDTCVLCNVKYFCILWFTLLYNMKIMFTFELLFSLFYIETYTFVKVTI